MAKRLFIVEDTFDIKKRGLVLVPGFKGDEKVKTGARIEIRRPGGSNLITEILGIEMSTPNPKRTFPILVALGKADVPIGTEVWIID